MTKINATYLEDGEWLSINTNPDQGGDLIAIVPGQNDTIVATDPSKGWARSISPAGHFTITAPYAASERLNDWGLELSGLPRMYEHLKMDVVSGLFGQVVTDQIEQYHHNYRSRRESVGDIIAKFMRRGPLRIEEGFSQMKSCTTEVQQDLNAETRQARAQLLASVSENSGQIVIARSVLIAD